MTLRNQILATLAYYDVFDFPLTREEIMHCLIRGAVVPFPEQLQNELENLKEEGLVCEYKGYHVLFNRNFLVPLRVQRQRAARKKWRIARRVLRWVTYIPGVEAIFGSGSLAYHNTHELSDLDVLIVTTPKRIWITRFLVSTLLTLLGVRRKAHEAIAPDKICLNHYITSTSLHIPFHNLYNAQTYINLVPIYLRDESLLSKFFQENSWITEYIQYADPILTHQYRMQPFLSFYIGSFFIWTLKLPVFDKIEGLLRRVQSQRVLRNPEKGVEVCDDYLSFHPDSQAEEVEEEYKKQLSILGINIDYSI